MTDGRLITATRRQHGVLQLRAGRARARRGFTLTELLVVIGIIVLMLALAVPLFNVFSGSRSVEGGQNMVSAMLQRARARALAMQERRGIFFFEDQVTRKTGMLLVKLDEPVPPPAPPAPPPAGYLPNTYVLELDEQDEEIQFLPQGVGAAFVLGANPTSATAANANATGTTYRPYGLVVFDGVGRIATVGNFTTEANDASRYPDDKSGTSGNPKPAGPTNLKWNYGKNIYPAGADAANQHIGKAVAGSVPQEYSHAGLILFDKQVYAEVQPDPSGDWRKLSTQQSQWLDQNGTALVVNRYNGTIIAGE
jgi:prepilin-type N-terminal cleavage/methylation domain-containing protein